MQSSDSIDLIKGKTDIVDEIIKWALNFGRFLIIVVEVVAFSAFIYRFVLDRQLVDLNDKIKQEQAIVESIREREKIYRNLQERIAIVKTVSSVGNTNLKLMDDIFAFTPAEISYNYFNVDKDQLQLEINVSSIPSLTTFLNSLKQYPRITSVTITGVDNTSGTNQVKVTIVAKLKGALR